MAVTFSLVAERFLEFFAVCSFELFAFRIAINPIVILLCVGKVIGGVKPDDTDKMKVLTEFRAASMAAIANIRARFSVVAKG